MDSSAAVTGVKTGAVSGPAPSTSVSPPDRAFNSAVSAAVRTLNETGVVGDGREVTFSLDRATRRPVIQVVETSTKEVITQWPPEYVLRLARINQDGAQIQDESLL